MNANVLAANPAMEGPQVFEAAMPAGPTLRERASDLADRFRGLSHSAYQAKSAFRSKSVNLANNIISRIENKHLRRAATVAAALGIMAMTEPTALKAGAAWAGDLEGGHVDLAPSDSGAESDTAALADHSSVATGHFVEGNTEAEGSTANSLDVEKNHFGNGSGQSEPVADIERNHFTWNIDKEDTNTVDVEKNHFTNGNQASASHDVEKNHFTNGNTATSEASKISGGHFVEGNEEAHAASATTTTGESAVDAQDNANSAAAAAGAGAGAAATGGHTADNEGLTTGTAPEGEKVEYESKLGEFDKKTGKGTIDYHLEQAAEARGLHLSESQQYLADQRYLEMHQYNGHQMTWDDARHLSNGYEISLTKDELDKIFEGFGDDTDAEDDDDTDSDTSTDDKKAAEEERKLEAEKRKLENEAGTNGDSTGDFLLDQERRHLERDPGLPVDTSNAKPSASAAAALASATPSPSAAAIAAASNQALPPINKEAEDGSSLPWFPVIATGALAAGAGVVAYTQKDRIKAAAKKIRKPKISQPIRFRRPEPAQPITDDELAERLAQRRSANNTQDPSWDDFKLPPLDFNEPRPTPTSVESDDAAPYRFDDKDATVDIPRDRPGDNDEPPPKRAA